VVGAWWLAPGRAAEAGLTARECTVDGLVRQALVRVPANAAGTAAPVVFAFHGQGGNRTQAARSFGVHPGWPEAIVVYLAGFAHEGDDRSARETGGLAVGPGRLRGPRPPFFRRGICDVEGGVPRRWAAGVRDGAFERRAVHRSAVGDARRRVRGDGAVGGGAGFGLVRTVAAEAGAARGGQERRVGEVPGAGAGDAGRAPVERLRCGGASVGAGGADHGHVVSV